MIQIEELGRVLGKILSMVIGLKNSGNIKESYQTTYNELLNNTNIDLDNLLASGDDQIKELLNKKFHGRSDLYITLANILFEIAETEQNPEKQRNIYTKSYVLYELSVQMSKTFSLEVHTKMDRIKQLINI